ncbi:PQQ-dependent sugar dehydrogenase [Streptomyces sp. NPDC051940]|uniref:PQQ-dependent sugar dehydrogenase n=1 Tax=Streptomyces sp. NPDC051940 TaxID=3155675 RepID=UPI00343A3757
MLRIRTWAAGLAALLAAGVLAGPATAASTLYEAENATIVSGVVESNHAGFTGTGFVNSTNATGSAIEFSVGSGTTLSFRYALGVAGERPATLTVNGVAQGTLPFPSTGTWTGWASQQAAVTLPAGTSTVRITATTSGGLANIDSLTVGDTSGGGSDPIADPIPQSPIPSGLGLELTEFAQFPKSDPVPAPTDERLIRHARINYLGQLPDGRTYVPDLNGKLYMLPPGGGTPAAYLDVKAVVGSAFFSGRGMGSGFGFVAFDPQFASNGRFYTVHSETPQSGADWTQSSPVVQSVLTEWTANNPAASVFQGTRRQLMRIGFANYIHAIQQIDFNPGAAPGSAEYGKLYVAVGDGGRGTSTTDPQNKALPFGKLLRIDPRGNNSANHRYGVPSDNPFAGQPGVLTEIYALGMRDPHRFSWDRGGAKRMFLGHIGEHDIEGVYDVRAGDNFGWSEREGAFVFKRDDPCYLYPLPADDATYGYDYPVAAYDHNGPPGCTGDLGRAVVGGFVYRGGALPALAGKYVFGDIVQGWVYYTDEARMQRGAALAPLYELKLFTPSGTQVSMQTLAGDDRVDLRFGQDSAGELYLMSKANGKVWKVTGVRGTAP